MGGGIEGRGGSLCCSERDHIIGIDRGLRDEPPANHYTPSADSSEMWGDWVSLSTEHASIAIIFVLNV